MDSDLKLERVLLLPFSTQRPLSRQLHLSALRFVRGLEQQPNSSNSDPNQLVKEKRQLRYPFTRWATGCIEVQDAEPIYP